jgi:hypothetical protein
LEIEMGIRMGWTAALLAAPVIVGPAARAAQTAPTARQHELDEPFDGEEAAWEFGLISGSSEPPLPFDRGDEDERVLVHSTGVPRDLDVRKVIANAELLVRARTVGRLRLENAPDRPIVLIEEVLKGDPSLAGPRGEIHAGADSASWAFFSWNPEFERRVALPHSTFVTALRRLDRPARADSLLHLQQQFAEGFGGLLIDPLAAPRGAAGRSTHARSPLRPPARPGAREPRRGRCSDRPQRDRDRGAPPLRRGRLRRPDRVVLER